MSIKKEVVTRTEVYTVYSSEMQERMKVYFDLTQEYNTCLTECPAIDEESKTRCEAICGKVYDKYPLLLQERYQQNPEKLSEVVTNQKSFETKRRPHIDGWFYRHFGFTLSGEENK
jgi:ribosomal protein S17E